MSLDGGASVKTSSKRHENVDLTRAAGIEHPAKKCSYNRRDVLLFANAIGVQREEIHFLYELHPNFAAFPTFPINLYFKRTHQDVFDMLAEMKLASIPGMPLLDSWRTVDGERGIEIIRPVPVSSDGLDLEVRSKLVGVYDKGGNLLMETESSLVDAKTNTVYTRMTNTAVGMGQGGYGGPRGPTKVSIQVPNRQPDERYVFSTSREMAHLYRLCGDYNPLHADDEFGRRAGFKGLILQGLGTWNIAAHGILLKVGNSDPERFKKFGARFRSPVYPGDKLETRIWKVGQDGDYNQYIFETAVESDGRIALSNGYASIRQSATSGPRL